MRHSELVVLALLHGGPRHGYEIIQDLESMRVRNWAQIGRSTVYKVLQRLEDRGELRSHTDRQGNRPERRVYRITRAGRSRLGALARKALDSRQPAYSDRVVGAVFAGLALEQPREALVAAGERAEASLKAIDEVAAGPISGLGLDVLRYTRAVVVAEATLIRAQIDRLDEPKEQPRSVADLLDGSSSR